MVKTAKPPKLRVVKPEKPPKREKKAPGPAGSNGPDFETFHYHLGVIVQHKAAVQAKQKILKQARRAAQDSGLVLEDLDRVIRLREEEPETVRASINRLATYAHWAGLAPGTQGDLFTAADADEPQQNPRDFKNSDARRGIRASERDRQGQQPNQQPLQLEKSKKHQPGAFRKLLSKLGVARVLLRMVRHHAFVEMHTEPQTPRADHRGDEAVSHHVPAAEDSVKHRHWRESKRPPDVHNPGVVHPARKKPNDHHHRHGKGCAGDKERDRIHEGRSIVVPQRAGNSISPTS